MCCVFETGLDIKKKFSVIVNISLLIETGLLSTHNICFGLEIRYLFSAVHS